MNPVYPCRTISVGIQRPWHAVYDYAAVPENFAAWASGLGQSLKRVEGVWVAQGADGPVQIRFAERNAYGVLDHTVVTQGGQEIYVPLRVIANGKGCEVLLTLFQLPGMDVEKFEADAAWIASDLARLKAVLES